MRLLRIADVHDNRTGGMSRTLHNTSDLLRARGHSVEHWFKDRLAPDAPPRLRRFIVPWIVARSVKRALQSGTRFDFVEIHEPSAAVYAALRHSLPPFSLFSFGLEERSHQATLAYLRAHQLPVSIKARFSPLTVVRQAQFALRRANAILCSSSQDVRHLSHQGINEHRVQFHRSGVSRAFLDAGIESQASSAPGRLLFLGNWLHRKGILELVTAANQVLHRHPNATLTIAGCNAPASVILPHFAPEVRSQIEVIPEIHGDSALIEVYRRHSLFVLPSYFEGQPLSLIEAASMGLGLITTRTCGMLDFVRDNENGCLVDIGDSKALADRIEKMIAQPQWTRALGHTARRDAGHQTWDAVTDVLERHYQSVV